MDYIHVLVGLNQMLARRLHPHSNYVGPHAGKGTNAILKTDPPFQRDLAVGTLGFMGITAEEGGRVAFARPGECGDETTRYPAQGAEMRPAVCLLRAMSFSKTISYVGCAGQG
jgi:hypothetical protein